MAFVVPQTTAEELPGTLPSVGGSGGAQKQLVAAPIPAVGVLEVPEASRKRPSGDPILATLRLKSFACRRSFGLPAARAIGGHGPECGSQVARAAVGKRPGEMRQAATMARRVTG